MEKINNIDYLFIENKKFKTNTISIYFKEKVSKENIIKRQSLPKILLDRTNKYNTKLKLSRKLSSLYSSSLEVKENVFGDYSLLTFSVNYIHKKYIENDITNEIIDFLNEVIYNPYTENDMFDESTIKRLKNEFYNFIKRKEQSLPIKTREQAIKTLYKDQSVINRLITNEHVDKIDNKEIYDYYQNLLKTNSMLIVVEGHEDIKDSLSIFNSTIKNDNTYETPKLTCENLGLVIKNDITTQANLCLIYDNFDDSKEFRIKNFFFAMLLGETSNSLLFQDIREKHSLAYSIGSNYDVTYKVMFIRGGVKTDSLDLTLSLINDILERLKTEDMTELVEETKEYYLNSIYAAMDSKTFYSARTASNWAQNANSTLEETIEKINQVSTEDIKTIAKRIQNKLIYVITGGSDESK